MLLTLLFLPLLMQTPGQEVAIPTDRGDLSGTLVTAPNQQKAALIISGSGPTDRDGNSAMGLKTDCLKMLAESLAQEGITTLRYDKRILSRDTATFIPEAELDFDRLVEDAVAGLRYLTAEGYEELVVIGHSQGALIGQLALRQVPEVKALITVAGPGKSIDEVILAQVGAQMPALKDELAEKLDSMKNSHQVERYNIMLLSLLRPSVQPFLISFMQHDPAEIMQQIDHPVLVINGTTDLQVDPEQARLLAAAGPNAELALIEGMNHVLKDAPPERTANLKTYNQPELALHSELVPTIITFIESLN
jgi:hypothetical protein